MSHLTRALFLVTVFFSIFVFFEMRVVSTQHQSIKDFAFAQLTSVVGVTARVAPNQDNTVVRELRLWEERLADKEQALVQSGASGATMQQFTQRLNILFGIELLLVLLLGGNFFLDYRYR